MRLGGRESQQSVHRAGFSLVEVLTTLVILGIGMAVFQTVFMSNWQAMEEYSTRAELWQDMDIIIDSITDDARVADRIVVVPGNRAVNFFLQGVLQANYQFTVAGQCVRTNGADVRILSTVVDPLSLFTLVPPSVSIRLVLANNVFERRVQIETFTEVFPRNRP